MRATAPKHLAIVACVPLALAFGCAKGPSKPLHRERFSIRDAECREPARPHAFMYPAENRTDYGPDNPRADGCVILVSDHLFCCPAVARATDR